MIGELNEHYRKLNVLQEERDLTESACTLLKESKARVWQLKKVRNNYNFQKAIVQWIKEGDANAFFFPQMYQQYVKL